MDHPPDRIVARALDLARRARCQKAQHGVVALAFRERSNGEEPVVLGVGYNEPAIGVCDGSAACRKDCSKRCIHAEAAALGQAALRAPYATLELVHVSLDANGELRACDGPSCWECSKAIVTYSVVRAVWLYELVVNPEPQCAIAIWRRYTAIEFHRATLARCDIGGPNGG